MLFKPTLDSLEEICEKNNWRVYAAFVQAEIDGGIIRKYWVSYGYLKHTTKLERVITKNTDREYSTKIEAIVGMVKYLEENFNSGSKNIKR